MTTTVTTGTTTVTTGTTASADGTAIGWTRTGEGPPVVLLHGTSSHASSWDPAARVLAGEHTLFAVDRRGRGRSGDADRYAFEREIEDVRAVVAAVSELTGSSPHLVGHSFGAIVALAAVADGVPVRSLVLYEPPFRAGDQFDLEAIAGACDAALAAGDRDGCLAAFYAPIGELPALEAMRGIPSLLAPFLAAAHTVPREIRAADRPVPELAAVERIPTLVLRGSRSPALFRDAVTLVTEAVPDAEVAVLEGQAHLAQAFAPAEFAVPILDFLARH